MGRQYTRGVGLTLSALPTDLVEPTSAALPTDRIGRRLNLSGTGNI
ncbi:MAG: hypothetical protein V3T39_07960 [Gammaproteobacteria bacterium]